MNFQSLCMMSGFISALAFSASALALDCPNAKTQQDITKCFSVEFARETKKINKTYSDYKGRLSQVQQQQLKEVQLAWVKFKDLACTFEASRIEDGSARRMILADCQIERTRQRNKELEDISNPQESDLTCSVCPVPL